MGLKDLFAAHDGSVQQARRTIDVEGMHCGACERRVIDALTEAGASGVEASHETGKVSFAGSLTDEAIAAAVTGVGFKLA